MSSGVLFAQFGFYGNDFGSVLNNLEQLGFFDYILPFLIIFSIIFGILSSLKIFKENKAINGIIALSVGLMALQFDFVPIFFREVFPRVGVGIVLLLLALIFMGMFMEAKSAATNWIFFGVGIVILISILIETAEATSLGIFGSWWSDNITTLLTWTGIIAIVGMIIGSTGDKNKTPIESVLSRALGGD